MKSGVEYLAQHPGWKTKQKDPSRFFIKVTRRYTYTKYLVKAATSADAMNEDGEYMGVVDEDDLEFAVEIHGPFKSKAALYNDIESYVEYT